MSRKSLIALLALIALGLTLAACESDEEDPCPEQSVVHESGLMHGSPCTLDAQCKYDFCYKASWLTKKSFGICTKPFCTCDPANVCSKDDYKDAASVERSYFCFLPDASADEDLKSYCMPRCETDNDCATLGQGFTKCEVPSGVEQTCTAGVK